MTFSLDVFADEFDRAIAGASKFSRRRHVLRSTRIRDPRRHESHHERESSTRAQTAKPKIDVLLDVMHDVKSIDAELRAIALQRQHLLAREAALLVRADELQLWKHFGCASLLDYLERVCDLHPRTAKERIRVAHALQQLPALHAAFDTGRIVYSTVRELSRIATADTEREWLDEVAGLSPREVEDAVSGRKRGDRPRDPRDPDRMVKLVLEVRASTYAQFVEARARYSDAQGERLDDNALVLALCRSDADDSPQQIAITTCRACTKSFQLAAGRELEVSAATAARAQCDAIDLGDLEADTPPRIAKTVSARMRRHVIARDGFICRVPGCRSTRHLDVHHIIFKSRRGSNKASNLITLCSGHHQQLHEGTLAIEGTHSRDVRFSWPSDPHRNSARDRSGGLCPVGAAPSGHEEHEVPLLPSGHAEHEVPLVPTGRRHGQT